jgi:L-arabinose isomerase
MYEGLGYAGEGDVLTAALVGALLKLDPRTSFTEMFCPDWEGGTIFLSHMGEINPRVCPETAELVSRNNKYTDCAPAMYAKGLFMRGEALLVNLVPLSGNGFRLIVCPVSMEGAPDSAFPESVRGWMRPTLPIADFLARYSLLGGTHHAALVYGEKVDTLRTFAEILGFDLRVIDGR